MVDSAEALIEICAVELVVLKNEGETETLIVVNGVKLELSDELKEGCGRIETSWVPVAKGDEGPADAFTGGGAPDGVEAFPGPPAAVSLQRRQPAVALKGCDNAANVTRTEPP
jgi:hypothetical protein